MEQDLIGAHCDLKECRQRDFLPFRCECGGTYCLEHRSYAAHSCRAEARHDHRVISCPLCGDSVHYVGEETIPAAFEAHLASECKNPHGRSTAKAAGGSGAGGGHHGSGSEKKKCCRAGCKEKLTTSNTATCSKCHRQTCLSHRFPDDHNCSPAASAAASAWAGKKATTAIGGLVSSVTGVFTGSASASGGGSRGSSSGTSGTEALRRSAAARQPQPQPQPASSAATVAAPAAPSAASVAASSSSASASSSSVEICPTCQGRFPSIMALIEHAEAEATHSGASTTSRPAPPAPGVVPITTTFGLPIPGTSTSTSAAATAAAQTTLPRAPPQPHLDLSFGWGSMIEGGSGGPPPHPPPFRHAQSQPQQHGANGSEQCPQCGASFADVVSLVSHVEAAHSQSHSQSQPQGQQQQQDGCRVM